MPLAAKGLGKLTEELGELLQVVGKKLAYYHTDDHPDDAGSLSERMEEEMGDVLAAIDFCMDKWELNQPVIYQRRNDKFNQFNSWDEDGDNNLHGVDQPAPPPPPDLPPLVIKHLDSCATQAGGEYCDCGEEIPF